MGFDADANGIYARAYNADGTTNGATVRVASNETGEQSFAEMAELNNGNVMFVFQDTNGFFNPGEEFSRGTIFSVTGNTGPGNGGGGTTPPAGPNRIDGDGSKNLLMGTAGEDIIRGFGDDDTLIGLGGNDTLSGGDGRDTVSYENASGGVKVQLNKELARGAEGRDKLFSIERVIGSDFDDSFIANAGGIEFNGLDGNNYFLIRSSSGEVSYLASGLGNDRFRLGDGDETVSDTGAGEDHLRAGGGDDTASMGSGDDVALMGDGDDYVTGMEGADRLYGHRGRNQLFGGDDDDRLLGGGGTDILWGDDGDDVLKGDNGMDVLIGGADDDNLTGGGGADQFVFGAGIGDGIDRIIDFQDGLDQINLFYNQMGWTTFQEVYDASSPAGTANMRIDLANGDRIIVQNFSKTDFTADDVSFIDPVWT